MKFSATVLVLVLLCALGALPALAQKAGGRAGKAGGADPSSMVTVSGVVEEYGGAIRGRSMRQGVHLLLRAGGDVLDVHLGPAWYVSKQEVKLATGDNIEVTGQKAVIWDRPAIIAFVVSKDGKTLKLRDPYGRPAWAGRSGGR